MSDAASYRAPARAGKEAVSTTRSKQHTPPRTSSGRVRAPSQRDHRPSIGGRSTGAPGSRCRAGGRNAPASATSPGSRPEGSPMSPGPAPSTERVGRASGGRSWPGCAATASAGAQTRPGGASAPRGGRARRRHPGAPRRRRRDRPLPDGNDDHALTATSSSVVPEPDRDATKDLDDRGPVGRAPVDGCHEAARRSSSS